MISKVFVVLHTTKKFLIWPGFGSDQKGQEPTGFESGFATLLISTGYTASRAKKVQFNSII
jgi:hypothetical protein